MTSPITYSSIIKVLSTFCLLIVSVSGDFAIAQTQRFRFGNPLEVNVPDPLLPQGDLPLSPSDKDRLQKATDDLNNQATNLLQEDKEEEAFDLWYRELRLRRQLGQLEEVPALGRVGEIAWQKNRKTDLQIISNRLKAIEQEASTKQKLESDLLQVLGKAYQQLRELDLALAIYQKLLVNVRQNKNIEAQKETLKIIGQLNLSRFDYANAAQVYEELLAIAKTEEDTLNQGIYLNQLAEIYQESSQPANGLKVKLQLAETYDKQSKNRELAELKLSIANDYQLLDRPEPASENYREAFQLAWSLQDFALASQALNKLGYLYQQYQQIDAALQIYQQLIKVEQKAYNFYGLMNTYDRLGQIYLEQNNYALALNSFRKGLEIAKSLNYQEDYFLAKIAQVDRQKTEAN
jgi:tetratricopeptide (TPR) repeat protein